ncbi:MAG: ribosome-associated translation inhibitor RaiA [Gammaproteobacteria bacterium]|jgi:putative sigma-54 modulation protein|nr:ribosome-associated translation inhibitor RaiA [Gammaproteobacteria bacterium]
MQINISGHHVEVTDALKDYVADKLQKLERHTGDITSIQAILSVEKNRQKAEATIRVKGADLFANAESEDMYAAIDLLTDKLDRQVVKHKEKMKSW